MANHRWLLTDPQGGSERLRINPESGGSPQRRKNFTHEGTLEPNTGTVTWQGSNEALTTRASGVILTREQYYQLHNWFEKDRELYLTDDLGRVFQIALTAFDPQRVWSRNPWRHTYTIEWVVLQELVL